MGRWALLATFISVIGCGAEGQDSGATCPTSSTLTYETFGREFMGSYCTRCHNSAKSGSERNGAPSDHNFDKIEDIRTFKEHIDHEAAAGPSVTNAEMPPSGVTPSLELRQQLGEWLACGAP